MDCVDSVVDQVFPELTEEVKTTEPPAQNVVGPPGVTVGAAGIGFIVMVCEASGLVQPRAVAFTV